MAPVPSFSRKGLLAILEGAAPEERLTKPVFFGRGTHEACAHWVSDARVFRLAKLEPDWDALEALGKKAEQEGRAGLSPGEGSDLVKPGAAIIEDATPAGFAAKLTALGPDVWLWP